MSNIQIDWQAFNRRDLETGRWKCCFCEKPSQPPKQFYCSDEHRKAFEIALSWPYVRRRVWMRDNKKCVKCGTDVPLHYMSYSEASNDFVFSKEAADIHHIIPVAYLWEEIIKAVEGLEGRERDYRLNQLKVIVFFHEDNLETLCEECHKKAHKSGWYEKFKFMKSGQKYLDSYIIQ